MIQELAELDLAVARILDAEHQHVIENREDFGPCCWKWGDGWFMPTRDGAEAMRLLEKYKIFLSYQEGQWLAFCIAGTFNGPTPAIAICRAVIALKGIG